MSLRFKLALYYTLGAMLTLSAASAYLYWSLKSGLSKVAEDLLREKFEVFVAAQREDPADPGELSDLLRFLPSNGPFSLVHARVLGKNGQALAQSLGMPGELPAEKFPAAGAYDHAETNGKSFLLFCGALPQGLPAQKVELALDLTGQENLLGLYRMRLAWVLALGLLLSAVAGTLAASRGLKPLKEISKSVGEVNASRLQLRLEAAAWPEELHEIVASFNQMLERLDDSFRKLSQFSADLAHELRSPLHALRTQAEVTLKRARSAEEYQEALESALEEYSRLSRMVESLLFLAKAEYSQLALEKDWLDGGAELEKVAEYFEAPLEEKKLRLERSGLAKIWADPSLLRRALTNLLSNALKFSPEGGMISVKLSQSASGSEIWVEDQGPGIPENELPRVTERFYRSKETAHAEGLGLGLAMVRSIMDLHGGRLSLTNGPRGVLAVLQFPPA
jgi:two-component system heavy metal sensor histidine kinase CusS